MNQAARRRIWSDGWVMPKVLMKAEARASRRRMRLWYALAAVDPAGRIRGRLRASNEGREKIACCDRR